MKRLIYIVALALCVAGACQKDGARSGVQVQCVNRLSVEIPQEVQTRAVSEGSLVDVVYYEVWSEDFTTRLFYNNAEVQNCIAEIDVALVKDQTYQMIFWAQKKSVANGFQSPFSWSNLKRVNVNYAQFTENNKDCYDAFYCVAEVKSDGEDKIVHLYRPFAQVNFGTNTLETAFGEFTINSNTMKISQLATAFDTVNGHAYANSYQSNVSIIASHGGLVQQETDDRKDLVIGDTGYYWVAMNYILVPSQDTATVKVDLTFNTSGGTLSHSIENVPIKKNYRTNIVGDLFTSSTHLEIVVDPNFKKPDINGPDFDLPAEDDNNTTNNN
jgi:hypothetical protein